MTEINGSKALVVDNNKNKLTIYNKNEVDNLKSQIKALNNNQYINASFGDVFEISSIGNQVLGQVSSGRFLINGNGHLFGYVIANNVYSSGNENIDIWVNGHTINGSSKYTMELRSGYTGIYGMIDTYVNFQ